MPRVIHSDDLPWDQGGHGELFAPRCRRLGAAAGGEGLGCSMVELDPGKTAWPFHYHRANEEALYVLEGEGTLRLGAERLRVRAGDYVAFPPGPEAAHQLTNTSASVLRYLVLSTMISPEVCVYPDAKKVGVIDALDDEDGQRRRVVTFPLGAEVGYWEGEVGSLGNDEAEAEAEAEAANREARIDEMVEDDLEALRRKMAQSGGATKARAEHARNEAETRRTATPRPEPEPEVDPIEADLDALRRKVAQSGGATKTGAEATPPKAEPATRPSSPSSSGDDIDDLKKLLDD